MSEQIFSAHSTTDEVLAGIQLQQQTAVVTGASSGIGEETCRALAAAGAKVVMVARDPAKLDAARERIESSLSQAKLETVLLDLADLDSVRQGAAAILEKAPVIDLLINNAGLMACPEGRSAQGVELQFATNHLGHFLLTGLLMPALKAADKARVVNLSSGGHKYSPVLFDDINFEQQPYDKWLAYGQAKTANALFTAGLAARGITSFAVHPGAIVTQLGRHLDRNDIKEMMAKAEQSGTALSYKSVEQGAATSVWAATSPTLEGKSGLFLEDCSIANEVPEGHIDGGYFGYALAADAAEKLWQLSEQLVGESIAV
jgi:NAD(P)-dependent dehydrogenase (short-subunit alcohol dehydrogenase family)